MVNGSGNFDEKLIEEIYVAIKSEEIQCLLYTRTDWLL
jgi:hypothetical protein